MNCTESQWEFSWLESAFSSKESLEQEGVEDCGFFEMVKMTRLYPDVECELVNT